MGIILSSSKELIKGRITIDQLQHAFDWKVEKADLYRLENEAPKCVPDFFATVRVNQDGSKNSLGVVKSRYTVIQNDEILETVNSLLGIGAGEPFDYQIKDNGARFAFRLLFPKYLAPNVYDDSDFLQLAIAVKGSHDGSSGLTVQVQPIRKICLNGFISLGKVYALDSIRHTANANLGLGNIRRVLESVNAEFDLIGDQIKRISSVNVDRFRAHTYIKDVLEITEPDDSKVSTRSINQVHDVEALFRRGKGNQGRTLWDAYNGVTEYVDHYRGTNDARTWNAVAGSGADLKRRALEVALEYAAA